MSFERELGRSATADRATLDGTDLDLLAGSLRTATLPAGSSIVRAGTAASHVHLLRSGAVELRRADDRRHTVIATLRDGDVVGDLGVFLGRPHHLDAVAVTEVELSSIAAEDLAHQIRERPALAERWFASLAARLVESHERLDEMLAGHLDQQVAAALAHRVDGDRRVDITQEQLARLLGVQRSSVNGAVRRLELRGLVRRGYGHVVVRDPAGLERLLQT